MASIAQDELRKLSESVKFGLSQSINRGVVLGSSNIYGYVKDRGRLVIDKEESKIVKEIYSLFNNGIYNYSKKSRYINNKYNRKMDCNTIKRILTNYKYKGYYCGRKSEVLNYKSSIRKNFNSDKWIIYKDWDRVPPIIEEDIWDRVNKIIKDRDKKNKNEECYEVFCLKHGNVSIKRKKYKENSYYYFKCADCFNISSRMLDRINKVKKIKKVYVLNGKELILKIVCQY